MCLVESSKNNQLLLTLLTNNLGGNNQSLGEHSCQSSLVSLVSGHVKQGRGHYLLLVLGLAVVVHELHVGVDQVHDDGVVHDVVLVLVRWTRTEVHSESFASLFDLVHRSCESISLGVHGDEQRLNFTILVASLGLEIVHDLGNLLHFFGTNIWTMSESKI